MTEAELSRFEEKFILSRAQYLDVLQLATKYLQNASPIIGTNYTLIQSVYFDSLSFSSLEQQLTQQNARTKVRLRRYAPNGIWDEKFIYLELKEKIDRRTIKNRFRCKLKHLDISSALESNLLEEFINDSSSESFLNQIKEKSQRIFKFALELKALPMTQVMYSREAYESNEFRVTFDQNLNVKASRFFEQSKLHNGPLDLTNNETLKKLPHMINRDAIVMELKHNDFIPEWMNEFLLKNSIVKCSFSKYAYSVAKSL